MNVTVGNQSIWVRTEGPSTAPAIVLIHGFPFNHTMWNAQIELLKDRFYVVALDLRGHGKTPASIQPFMLEQLVDDVAAIVDQFKISQPIVCGLSMGGYIALRFAERHPERCRALVLCDTKSEADSDAAKLKRASQISFIRDKGVPAFADAFLPAVLAKDTLANQPEVVQQVRGMIEMMSPEAVQAALVALATRTDTTGALAALHIPTVVLTGEQDSLTPPAAGEALAKNLQGRFQLIPSAGHVTPLENPTAFNEALLRFLNELA